MIVAGLLLSSSIYAKEKLSIPAGESVEFTSNEFQNADLRLSNPSGKNVNVAVLAAVSRQKIKGFGLAPNGSVELIIEQGEILKLSNASSKEVTITIDFIAKKEQLNAAASNTYISFTLHNSSLKSIPLIIPDVMNPNLSPLSNSGVSLKIGQKIYYKKGLSRKILLVVDETIKPGGKVDVARLIRQLEKDS